MNPSDLTTRRRFLQQTSGTLAAAGLSGLLTGCDQMDWSMGRSGDSTSGGPAAAGSSAGRLFKGKLGLDTYMLHRTLTAKDPANRRDIWWLVHQLDQWGFEGVQIDPSHFPGDDEETLERLASIVKPRGLYVEFGMGGWDPERMTHRIKLTSRFGGRALRTFCGSERNSQEEIRNFIKWSAPAFRDVAGVAEEYDVSVAIENHGDFTSTQLEELIQLVDHPRIGACVDTGNSLFRKEDPIECARRLAPYATSMHLKDWVMTFNEDDEPEWKETPLGEGQVPVEQVLRIVLKEKPDLYIALESPAQPSDNESETVRREQAHVASCAKVAKKMLSEL